MTSTAQLMTSKEKELFAAFKILLASHYWVEGPEEGGPQVLYRTTLEEGKFVGIREKVLDLEATTPGEAILEAAAILQIT